MRTQEMIQKDLDAVARTFPNARGSMLPEGLVGVVPMPIKRFDFLAKGGGDLSVEELALVSKQ